jgi:hypothetical protein
MNENLQIKRFSTTEIFALARNGIYYRESAVAPYSV